MRAVRWIFFCVIAFCRLVYVFGFSDTRPARLLASMHSIGSVDVTPRLATTHVAEPPVRSAGEIVPDVDALVAKLKALGAI